MPDPQTPNGWPNIKTSNWVPVTDDAVLPLGNDDVIIVRQWSVEDQTYRPRRVKAKDLLGQMSTSGLKDVLKETVQITPGLIVVGGKNIDVAVPGSKTTDVIIPNGMAGGLTLGTIITDAQITVDGTMRVVLSTTIALGITLGAINFKYTRFVF